MTINDYIAMDDADLLALYDKRRHIADGEGIGSAGARQLIQYPNGERRVVDAESMTASEFLAANDCDSPLADYELALDLAPQDIAGDFQVLRLETGTQSSSRAIAEEGWDLVREMSDRTDVITLLARDGDALYIVSDIYGPWAIQLTYADGSDRLDNS